MKIQLLSRLGIACLASTLCLHASIAKNAPLIANAPVEITCTATPVDESDGVLVAQGGRGYGYAVYVQNANLCFSIRNKSKLTTVTSEAPAPAVAFGVKATLADGGEMRLFVDGEQVAIGNAGTVITTQPAMAFSVGMDIGSAVGTYILPFAYAGKVSDVMINTEKGAIQAAAPSTKSTEPEFFTPEQDRDALTLNTKNQEGLPNVLIIGDSISLGYTKPTIALLDGVVNTQRIRANAGDTNSGLKNIKARWLSDTKWDVIHFNFGLHDLCYRNPESTEQGHRDKINGTQAVPLAQYEKNLEALVLQLKETGAILIWASTTVVPEGEAGRVVGDDVKYNAVAEKIMKKHGIAINDLHALTVSFGGEYSLPGDVHYNKAGSTQLAEQVAESIKQELTNEN